MSTTPTTIPIPIEFFAPEVPPKKTTSEAQKRANRENAKKSTGPKSVEGKQRSSQNSFVHGLCAEKVMPHGVDPEAVEQRFHEWNTSLNPTNDSVNRYLVGLAVNRSIRLEQCDGVYHADAAKLARDARKKHKQDRATEVERLARLLNEQPDTAARQLRETPEGCEYLIRDYGLFRLTLQADPPNWDGVDERRIVLLKGWLDTIEKRSPSPLYYPTLAIKEYRDLDHKIWLNQRSYVEWKDRYPCPEDLQKAIDSRPEAREKAMIARDQLLELIAREIAYLEALRLELIAEEQMDIDEAACRASFDDSDRARLLRRYEGELERGLHKTIQVVSDRSKEIAKSAQDVAGNNVVTNESDNATPSRTAEPTEPSFRNEPNFRGSSEGESVEKTSPESRVRSKFDRNHQE